MNPDNNLCLTMAAIQRDIERNKACTGLRSRLDSEMDGARDVPWLDRGLVFVGILVILWWLV